MKILITGNMGYIGPCVVQRLRAAYPDAALAGLDMGFFANCLTNAGVLPECRVDVQHFRDVRRISPDLLEGVDSIVHLAAISNDPMGNAFERVTHDINYLASVRLAEKAREAGVGSFVYASSCSMYGAAEDKPRTEKSQVNPLTAYAKSKIAAERVLERLADSRFSVTSLRFATACGFSERLRLDLVLNDFVACAVSAKKITILSDGTPWRPLINVKDMARAIDWAVSRDPKNGGAFLAVNVGSDEWNYQVKELAEAVAQVIPGVNISINRDARPDMRSYRVSFELFRSLAPDHQPESDIRTTVEEIKEGLDAMNFRDNNFRSSGLMRLKVLTHLREQGLLTENLEWTNNHGSSARSERRMYPVNEKLTDFSKSGRLNRKFHEIIPGGAHTYAKGDDQFPEFALPYIIKGEGCHVWDMDGNEYIEYGMGLRAVTLGHAYKPVMEASYRQMLLGSNFIRPAAIELECAEELLSMIEGAEMVKFGKNGSDVTTAAIKLSRAYTGRDVVAICGDQPFFSADDWFIGTTPMSSGIPKVIRDLTVKFRYNDMESVNSLFQQYVGRIACVIMEAEKDREPANNFLNEVQKICKENGAVFILDEMITGFRWHNGGAQGYYDIIPDLSAFGKAMGNGFSVSALAGKRELMRLGGLEHDRDRVFLLSLTHGAETHSLAAALETMRIYRNEPVIDFLWMQGERLSEGINKSIAENGLHGYFEIIGKPCCLVYATRDRDKRPSQRFRTLLLQETMRRGILATSLVVSYSHTDADVARTIEAFHEALRIYRKALDEGIEKYLTGRPVKPVWRTHN